MYFVCLRRLLNPLAEMISLSQVPFWQSCQDLMMTMGGDAFAFDLKSMKDFVEGSTGIGPCVHSLSLFEAAKLAANTEGSDLCSAERLPDRIQEVNSGELSCQCPSQACYIRAVRKYKM